MILKSFTILIFFSLNEYNIFFLYFSGFMDTQRWCSRTYTWNYSFYIRWKGRSKYKHLAKTFKIKFHIYWSAANKYGLFFLICKVRYYIFQFFSSNHFFMVSLPQRPKNGKKVVAETRHAFEFFSLHFTKQVQTSNSTLQNCIFIWIFLK